MESRSPEVGLGVLGCERSMRFCVVVGRFSSETITQGPHLCCVIVFYLWPLPKNVSELYNRTEISTLKKALGGFWRRGLPRKSTVASGAARERGSLTGERVESSPSWARVTRGGWFQQHGVEVSRKSVFEKEEFRYLVKHD